MLARNLMEMKQMCWEEVDTSYVLLDALPILDLFRLLFAIKQTIFDDPFTNYYFCIAAPIQQITY